MKPLPWIEIAKIRFFEKQTHTLEPKRIWVKTWYDMLEYNSKFVGSKIDISILKEPWACTNCGKVGYTEYPMKYAEHGAPLPVGWMRHYVYLGYGRNVVLLACSDKCRIELEYKYKVDFIHNREIFSVKRDIKTGLPIKSLSNIIYKMFKMRRY